GRLLLTGSGRVVGERASLQLWHADTARPACPPVVHEGRILTASFSPDGCRVVTGSADKKARIVDVATGALHRVPLEHEWSVYAAAFSPDGKQLLTGSREVARLWDVATGKVLTTWPHRTPVVAAAFHPNGKWALTGCRDEGAKLWDMAMQRHLHTL